MTDPKRHITIAMRQLMNSAPRGSVKVLKNLGSTINYLCDSLIIFILFSIKKLIFYRHYSPIDDVIRMQEVYIHLGGAFY